MAKKYPAIFALAAVITGILLADHFNIPSWIFLFSGLILLIVLISLYYKGKFQIAGVAALICLAVISSFGYTFRMKTYPPGHIIHFVDDDQKYTVFGTVADWPVIKNYYTNIIISVDSIGLGGEVKRGIGRLLIHLGIETTDFQYGDRIYFDSRLNSIKGGQNPTGFDYRRYLNLKGVFAVAYLPHQYNIRIDRLDRRHLYRITGKIRNYIIDTFKRTLDTNSSALASGFLIGDTRNIPTEIYDCFRDSGTLHLLAVSGSNVGLVVMMFIFLLKASPMKRHGKTILLLLIIFIFSNLAFNQPSVVRAAVMASLVLIGKYMQRRIELNNIIALTALIILLVKPTELFDVGFQLSFATAWGLIFLLPAVSGFFRSVQNRLYYKILIFPFLICVIAQLVSLPMSAYYFQRMPMISFVSNLIIVPLVSIIVIGSLILLLASLILPFFGSFVGSLLNPLISGTLYFIRQFGSEKLNVILQHQVTGVPVILFYILLIMLSFSIYSKRARRLTLLYLFIAANGLVISGLMSGGEDNRLTIFSLSKGIVSVNRGVQSQVVLCNLPPKEYLISEKIIEPYLANLRIKNPDLIALSVGYQTIKEASYLVNTNKLSKLYLPRTSRSAFMDILNVEAPVYDSARIEFYDSLSTPIDLEKADMILSNGMLLYVFDSSMIIFLNNAQGLEILSDLPSVNDKEKIVIKPFITKEDLSYLSGDMVHNVRAIICNKAYRSEWLLISGQSKESENIPRIIQASQSGAVELIIRKGAIWRLK